MKFPFNCEVLHWFPSICVNVLICVLESVLVHLQLQLWPPGIFLWKVWHLIYCAEMHFAFSSECECVWERERERMSKGFSWRFFKDAFNSFPWAFHEDCMKRLNCFRTRHDAYSTLKTMLEYLIYYICLEVSVHAIFFILFRKYIWPDRKTLSSCFLRWCVYLHTWPGKFCLDAL